MSTLKQLVDETTNIKNELKTCHANLKNNLIENGVECSDTDKLLSLVGKVGEIETVKYASGKIYKSLSHNHTYFNQPSTVVKIPFNAPLDFVPKTVVITVDNMWNGLSSDKSLVGKCSNFIISNKSGKVIVHGVRISPVHEAHLTIIDVDLDGFTVEIDAQGGYAQAYITGYEVFNM